MSSRPPSACGIPPNFGPWLQSVAASLPGSAPLDLSAFEAALEAKYDHPAQVVAIYAAPGGGLDPQFFEDTGVADAPQQAAFKAWFAALQDGVAAAKAKPPEAPPPGVDVRSPAPLPPAAPAATAAPTAGPPTAVDMRGSFTPWLRVVDPSGGLDGYAEALQAQYDCPAQVVGLYSAPGRGLDPQFLADAGIQDRAHASLFEAWFAASSKDASRSGSLAATVEQPHVVPTGDPASDLAGGFEQWLQVVDPAGRLGGYAAALALCCDSPAQAVFVYQRDGGVDPLLFEDAGVRTEHRPLFEAWFAAWCARAS